MERFEVRADKSLGAIQWGGWGVWDLLADAWAFAPKMTPEEAAGQALSWNAIVRTQAEKAERDEQAAQLATFNAYEEGRPA